jgi:hypothetical protein
MAMSNPMSQPNIACGPPPLIVPINNGIVMNGPTPTMLDMFNAVAWSNPKRRCKCVGSPAGECFVMRGFYVKRGHKSTEPSRRFYNDFF